MSGSSKGKFVYCFIDEGNFRDFGIRGIKNDSNVYTINYRDIAAVVSDEPLETYIPYEQDIETFQKVIERVMSEYTVIPVTFGTVAKNEKDILDFLEGNYDAIKELIVNFKGKIEMGLRVFWNESGFLEDVETDEIKRMKTELVEKEPTQMELLSLGEKVQSVANMMRNIYKAEIFDKLLKIAKDGCLNDVTNPKMILNAAFLIEKNDKEQFDEAVCNIYEKYSHKMIFKYSGPWPPYNFVKGINFNM